MKRIQPYNKAVYGSLAVALTQIIVYLLAQYRIDVPPEVAAAMITLITAVVVYAVPNIERVKPEPEGDDSDDNISR